jgi:hypothetical protein
MRAGRGRILLRAFDQRFHAPHSAQRPNHFDDWEPHPGRRKIFSVS